MLAESQMMPVGLWDGLVPKKSSQVFIRQCLLNGIYQPRIS